MEEPTFSTREEDEEEEEEEEQALTGKEDLALRVDGTTSRERLMGITARVGGTTRPWYSKSLKTHEKKKFLKILSGMSQRHGSDEKHIFKKRGRVCLDLLQALKSKVCYFFLWSLDVLIQATRATYKAPKRHAAKDV